MKTNRRQFLSGAGALAASGSLAMPAIAQAKPKVVVVGGGPGGATAAKYVTLDSDGAIDVTLVEPRSNSSPASIPISISAASAISNRSPIPTPISSRSTA